MLQLQVKSTIITTPALVVRGGRTLPLPSVKFDKLINLPKLQLADPNFKMPSEIDSFIDAGIEEWLRIGKNVHHGEIHFANTVFGYVVSAAVELPYISCKNLAEVVRFRHYLQESCKNLGFQTNLSDSCRSDISCRFRPFLQDSCRSRHFLQDSWTDLARQCLKLERYSARKCLECTGNNKAFFQF